MQPELVVTQDALMQIQLPRQFMLPKKRINMPGRLGQGKRGY